MKVEKDEESSFLVEAGRKRASLVGEDIAYDLIDVILELMKNEMSQSVLREFEAFETSLGNGSKYRD